MIHLSVFMSPCRELHTSACSCQIDSYALMSDLVKDNVVIFYFPSSYLWDIQGLWIAWYFVGQGVGWDNPEHHEQRWMRLICSWTVQL